MTRTAEERVAVGARWLDEIKPDWRERVDLDTLDIASNENCVVAQVFAADLLCDCDACVDGDECENFSSGYDRVTATLGWDTDDMRARGLIGDPGPDRLYSYRLEDEQALTEAWKKLLNEALVPA